MLYNACKKLPVVNCRKNTTSARITEQKHFFFRSIMTIFKSLAALFTVKNFVLDLFIYIFSLKGDIFQIAFQQKKNHNTISDHREEIVYYVLYNIQRHNRFLDFTTQYIKYVQTDQGIRVYIYIGRTGYILYK